MKTEKEKLQAKTVDQLKRYANKFGANIVDPKTGKAKTKEQLVNTILIMQRLKKIPIGSPARKKLGEKPKTVQKIDALKSKAYKIGYKSGLENKALRPGGNPEVLTLIKNLPTVKATAVFKSHNKGWTDAKLMQSRTVLSQYLKNIKS